MSPSLPVDLIGKYGGAHGGIARYASELQRGLTEAGADVRLAAFRYLPGANRRPVLKALPIGIEGRRANAIVHIPQLMGASVLLVSRLRPSVVTVHDLGFLCCPEDRLVLSRFDQQLIRLSLLGMKRADHLIAVSEFTRQSLVARGYRPERITTIPEGVDTDRFRPIPDAAESLQARYGIDVTSRPVVLYVGNEFPRKNLATLVRALGMLKQEGLRVRWVKVGRSAYPPGRRELLQLIERERLLEDVSFVEGVSDDDLPLFYAAASVYVQPSVCEGFGLPVLEAMACGAPVVAMHAASLPEVCQEAALFIMDSAPEDCANAIRSVLIDQSLRERLRTDGVKRAARFSWNATALRTLETYHLLGHWVR